MNEEKSKVCNHSSWKIYDIKFTTDGPYLKEVFYYLKCDGCSDLLKAQKIKDDWKNNE